MSDRVRIRQRKASHGARFRIHAVGDGLERPFGVSRFELKPGVEPGAFGQGPVIALLDRIAEHFEVSSFELLRNFDGKPGYSLAQGQ